MRDAILKLITGPEGYGVALFGDMLAIARLENGQYSVSEGSTGREALYDSPGDAVDDFLAARLGLGLGYDFEGA